ncbi:MAG: hypothetical protein AABZ01_04545, partial [Gemmatimonadota bacterium]
SDLVAGMWMGFDNPTKIMGNATGGRLVAPAWAAMMRDIYARRRPPPDWVAPEGILLEQIDESTGFRATPFCPLSDVILQYFIPGTEPQLFCPTHSRGGLIGGTGLPH